MPQLDPPDGGWDRRLGRLWGTILALMVFWPLITSPESIFVWDIVSSAMDAPDGAGVSIAEVLAAVVLPHVLGIVAIIAASAVSAPRTRGVVYAAGALLWLFLGFRLAFTAFGLPSFGGPPELFSRVLLLMVMFVIGPAFLAAGNRVQKREEGATLPRVVAGMGGLAIVAGYFLPIGEVAGRSRSLIDIFGEAEVWTEGWYFALWNLGFFAFGLFGAGLLLPGGNPEGRGRPLSVLARVLPIGLMVVVLILMAQTSSGGGFGTVMMMALRSMLLFLGMAILLAVGLALLIESPSRRVRYDHSEAF